MGPTGSIPGFDFGALATLLIAGLVNGLSIVVTQKEHKPSKAAAPAVGHVEEINRIDHKQTAEES